LAKDDLLVLLEAAVASIEEIVELMNKFSNSDGWSSALFWRVICFLFGWMVYPSLSSFLGLFWPFGLLHKWIP
jgi:hypothetical protein